MTSEQDRIAFLRERKTGIGGSDMAAIKGLSPWATAVTIWLDKTQPDNIDPSPSSPRLDLGTWLEEPLAKWYEQETGRKVQRFSRMLRKGHVIGHIDRLVCPDGKKRAFSAHGVFAERFLEIKTTGEPSDWEEGVPAYYLDQIHTYFGLAESLQVCDVPVVSIKPFVERDIKSVERDDEIASQQIEFGNWWWDEYVAANKPPPCVSEEDAKAVWRVREKGKIYTATPAQVEAVKKLKSIEAAKAELDAEASAIRADLENAMQDADTMKAEDGKTLLTWRQSEGRKTTSWKSVAAELNAPADLVEKFTVTGEPFRTFKLAI